MRGVFLLQTFVAYTIAHSQTMKPKRSFYWYFILLVSFLAILVAVLGLLLG